MSKLSGSLSSIPRACWTADRYASSETRHGQSGFSNSGFLWYFSNSASNLANAASSSSPSLLLSLSSRAAASRVRSAAKRVRVIHFNGEGSTVSVGSVDASFGRTDQSVCVNRVGTTKCDIRDGVGWVLVLVLAFAFALVFTFCSLAFSLLATAFLPRLVVGTVVVANQLVTFHKRNMQDRHTGRFCDNLFGFASCSVGSFGSFRCASYHATSSRLLRVLLSCCYSFTSLGC